jgi:hypothetical protein
MQLSRGVGGLTGVREWSRAKLNSDCGYANLEIPEPGGLE